VNSTFYKKIELVANVSIIAVAVILGFVLIKRFVLPPAPTEPGENIRVGTRISVPDINWSQSERNLVLVLQKGCHFCTESGPFYQQLTRETTALANVRLIAALPQDVGEASQYLSDLGVAVNEIRQVPPASLGVRGTPTLLLVDNTGIITDFWVGKLSPDKEAEVLRRLKS
jgi:hypothetical protein